MAQLRPTGFLALPLELRQEIYGQILPADGIVKFPSSQQGCEEKTITAMCAAHPVVNEELQKLVYKCNASILVAPHKKMGLPRLEWWRFAHITVEIDHYEDHTRPERWAGVKEVVRRLQQAESLPELTIFFHEIGEMWSGDLMWTQEMPIRSIYCWQGSDKTYSAPRWKRYEHQRQRRYGKYVVDRTDSSSDSDDYESTILQTTGDFYGNPITIEILDHFLDLPPCKSAVVKSLRASIDGRDVYRPRHNPEERAFDQMYMWNLHGALECWLMGDRDVVLPQGLSIYGEPRLEQLAYSERNEEELYCSRARIWNPPAL